MVIECDPSSRDPHHEEIELIEFLQLSDIAEFLGRISVHGQSDIGSKADTPG